jgi:hypothetical protein
LVYHFASAVLFSLLILAASAGSFNYERIAISTGLVAVHGIYSLSFLELWSLAQGSYSISILTGVPSHGSLRRSELIRVLARIGDAKKGDRLTVLSKSSLVQRDGQRWRLSPRGRVLASMLNALLWLAAIRKPG